MLAHLGIMEVDKALEGVSKLPATMDAAKKEKVLKKAYNTLILSLGDKVLREVIKCTTAAKIWVKLYLLYMTKSFSNWLYLKTRFYIFMMTEEK